ncbi:MAG: F0F1 ATP synthase subunit B [Actinobacteria bacterium]|jgi:F-type H+-transporting ATPase subunit b|nr:F0F1 ATP synthase subunit B [Actinomycetota bacterium]NDH80798.1 F0F1 ATP synthase subunit B [Actinomycetota bacterium]NDH99158.1 F0F1 ATP synthase subunit B [Actinomycetota bacterium]NDI07964.1 F0F1 ATP synthase subunit B [Actinomycetota bacterium]
MSNTVILAAGEKINPLVPHTAELIVGAIAFTLLFLVLRSRVVPMFEKAFAARTEAIQGGMERAEKAQLEAQRALVQYNEQLSKAREEAQTLREEARAQGSAIVEELRAKAQEEAARITAAAHASIEAERQQAVTSLRNEVGTLAVELASKIVGEALEDQARQSRIVDRFLDDLENSKSK